MMVLISTVKLTWMPIEAAFGVLLQRRRSLRYESNYCCLWSVVLSCFILEFPMSGVRSGLSLLLEAT